MLIFNLSIADVGAEVVELEVEVEDEAALGLGVDGVDGSSRFLGIGIGISGGWEMWRSGWW
jgi:hypothetical protein